jgi:hypothetical protein
VHDDMTAAAAGLLDEVIVYLAEQRELGPAGAASRR